MVVRGVGIDIIEIDRIKDSIERHHDHFVNRIFTMKEQEYCLLHKNSWVYFAGRFVAKEAVVKALGTGFRDGISWLDIEILNDSLGKPCVYLSESIHQTFNTPQILLSISHCRQYAAATAILI